LLLVALSLQTFKPFDKQLFVEQALIVYNETVGQMAIVFDILHQQLVAFVHIILIGQEVAYALHNATNGLETRRC